jgi:hypothetical protein
MRRSPANEDVCAPVDPPSYATTIVAFQFVDQNVPCTAVIGDLKRFKERDDLTKKEKRAYANALLKDSTAEKIKDLRPLVTVTQEETEKVIQVGPGFAVAILGDRLTESTLREVLQRRHQQISEAGAMELASEALKMAVDTRHQQQLTFRGV